MRVPPCRLLIQLNSKQKQNLLVGVGLRRHFHHIVLLALEKKLHNPKIQRSAQIVDIGDEHVLNAFVD